MTFDSHWTALHHRAAGDAPRACVALGHGFTMARDAGPDRDAERFQVKHLQTVAARNFEARLTAITVMRTRRARGGSAHDVPLG